VALAGTPQKRMVRRCNGLHLSSLRFRTISDNWNGVVGANLQRASELEFGSIARASALPL
jgi:hypothetical protein